VDAVTIVRKTFLQSLTDHFLGDPNPYQEGKIAFWKCDVRKPTFRVTTVGGFLAQCRLTAEVWRHDDAAFTKARMLEEQSIQNLEGDFCQLFLRWLKDTDRQFYISSLYGRGHVIRLTEDGTIDDEINCSKTTKAFGTVEMPDYGCRVELILCDVWVEKENERSLQENCIMIPADLRAQMEEEFRNRKMEEAWTMILLREWLKIQKNWNIQFNSASNRDYNANWISVHVETQGNEVILRWKFKEEENSSRFHLRVFRKEGGFALTDDVASQGTLVVDRWGSDWKAERLDAGKTYFYTMLVSYSHKTGFLGNERTEVDQERLRFEVTTPPGSYVADLEQKLAARVERLEAARATTPPDPSREKKSRALEELSAFVEFDDNISQWEKDLIKQIESKGYPTKERKEKIERLRLLVEDLREKHL
jgi:hypothetical protein